MARERNDTLYAAVARRSREIGVLRVLGFGAGSVLASFVIESAMLGLAGAIIGEALGVIVADATGHPVADLISHGADIGRRLEFPQHRMQSFRKILGNAVEQKCCGP